MPNTHNVHDGMPMLSQTPECHMYAVPAYEYKDCMKVAYHGGAPCDPDNRDALTVCLEGEWVPSWGIEC